MIEQQNILPRVAIIMPNWNGKMLTLDCLRSIVGLNYPKERLNIVVSDNGSTDGSQDAIRTEFEHMSSKGFGELILIENGANLGAPAAYNRGISAGSSPPDYVLKIDNDVFLDPDAIITLIKRAESDPNIGLVGGCEFCDRAMQIVQSIGSYILSQPFFIPRYPMSDSSCDHRISCDIDAPTGAMLLIKFKVIKQIGLFDERFFVYWDDFDFSIRSLQAGFRSVYEPQARYWHKASSTTGGRRSAFYLFYITRNRLFFIRKHSSRLSRYINVSYMLFASLYHSVIFIARGERYLARAVFNAINEGLRLRV